MKTLIIIPSRLSATRLPGKPLLKINGLSIISHVFKKAEETNIGEVFVATQDQEIIDDVKKNGGQAILTNKNHKTGTDRINEAIKKLCDSKSKVSSHYFIKEDGKVLNLVPDLYEAWHAGKSCWKNYVLLNKYSIGIEIHNLNLNYKVYYLLIYFCQTHLMLLFVTIMHFVHFH